MSTKKTNLQVPAIRSNSGLRQIVETDKLEVDGPDTTVLGDGQGAQRSVKGTPRPCHPPLIHQKLYVVDPNARHLQNRKNKINK
jgi:hypothetical protein